MKKFNTTDLLEELQADVRQLLLTATHLQKEDPEMLLTTSDSITWSVAQILEHLNSYGRYYLPAIAKSLKGDKPHRKIFTPGWFGNYFTKIMRPGADGKIKYKMKSPKAHCPAPDLEIKPVMEEFARQQQLLLGLLEKAKQKDIGSIRTPISISRFLRLKVGDTFRFLIAHEQRHFLQIAGTIEILKGTRDKFQLNHQATQRSPAFSHG